MNAARRAWPALFAFALVHAHAAAGAHERTATESQVEFSVRTLWTQALHGRFGRVDGALRFDAQGRAVLRATIDVDAAEIDPPRYNARLRSADFFDVANHPRMRFVSAAFAPSLLAEGGVIEGTLSLRGVTRTIALHLAPGTCRDPQQGPCRIRASGRLRRSAFGMRAHRIAVADRVELRLDITLARPTR